jgi:hypothetical protein
MKKHYNIIEQIKHDIRNMSGLNSEQMEYVLNLDNKEKDEIIILFNDILKTCTDYIIEYTN